MRAAFFNTLRKKYEEDSRTFVLTADLGYKLFDPFQEACSDRFYDIGVAEANMIGVAAGLALSGKNVYCYSIIPFLIMRPFEQIRVDVAYHNLDIKLVGVGGGFTYGLEGFTHFGLEDFALMRSLPNVSVVVPADPFEAQCLATISHAHKGPLYIRLGKTGEPAIHTALPEFKIGKPIYLSEGKRVAIFAIGSMVHVCSQVLERLRQKGINATLINMHTLKPLDSGAILQAANAHDAIFTAEEHYVDGGLGSAVAEVLAESGKSVLFRRIGVDRLKQCIGNGDHLKEQYGLDADHVFNKIMNDLKAV